MIRFSAVLIALSFGCASAATPAPAYPDAKARADKAWQTADSQKTNAPAWEHAGEALALAAQATEEDTALAAPLLKGALAAWSKSEKLSPALSQVGKKKESRRPLSRRETLRIAVLQQLAALTDPQDPELAMITYSHGRVLYNLGYYSESVEHFLRVVEQFPDKQEAKYASSLVLDALLISGDLDGLEKQASKMLKNKPLTSAHPELIETLELVRHQAAKRAARALVDEANKRAEELAASK